MKPITKTTWLNIFFRFCYGALGGGFGLGFAAFMASWSGHVADSPFMPTSESANYLPIFYETSRIESIFFGVVFFLFGPAVRRLWSRALKEEDDQKK